MYVLIILFFGIEIYSQSVCDPSLNSNVPPSPYIDGYLSFNGRGEFARTSDINSLEFPANTTDSFSVFFKLKISSPFKPMYIFGKWRGAGWIVGYNNNESGYLSIYINNEWKRIYQLDADTNWHDYLITYKKSDLLLNTYTDDILTNTYQGFTYTNMASDAAFSVGNVGFLAQYGPQTVNLTSLWFCGSVASIRITSNANCIVNYGFNEGGGQVARDSLTYFYTDRTYPGSSTCGISHLMLGYMPSEDTCDPVWSSFDNPVQSQFSPLGTGMQFYYSNGGLEFNAEHFSTAMTTWNSALVNTGYFNRAGGTNANFIAAWNGFSWAPLGSGLNHEALALASFRGELYATGFFDTAGGNAAKYIAKWNGSSWQNLGTGLDNIGNVLLEYNNDLIVGGWFNIAGGEIAPSVARWDGTAWHSMSTGMSGPVYALCVYNGELYAGGNFVYCGTEICNGIAKWDGYKWNPAGGGTVGGDKTIYTLAVYNNELYAGGAFIKMDNITCYNIARYNGVSWSSIGSGAKGALCSVSQGYVICMKVLDRELYISGMFSNVNGETANKLAKFNGLNWCSVEYGVDLRPRSLEVFNNDLIINGDFYSASGVESSNIVKYTPKRNLTGITNNNIPLINSLEQNYPNPFNPKTKISFKLAENGFVTLKVYDLTGKETAVILNKDMSSGTHETDFDGSSLSSGVYIYRLETTGKDGIKTAESRKMVLIK